jgi:hypothetical protein
MSWPLFAAFFLVLESYCSPDQSWRAVEFRAPSVVRGRRSDLGIPWGLAAAEALAGCQFWRRLIPISGKVQRAFVGHACVGRTSACALVYLKCITTSCEVFCADDKLGQQGL